MAQAKRQDYQQPLLQPPAGSAVWVLRMGWLQRDVTPLRDFTPAWVSPHLVLAGQGRLWIGGREYPLRAGDLFGLWPGGPVRYAQDPDHPWQLLWCHLSGEGAPAAGRALGLSAEAPVWRPADPAAVREALKELFRRFSRPQEYPPAAVLAAFYDWVAAVDAPAAETAAEPPARRLVRQARLLLEGLPEAMPNVAGIARTLRVSRTTLFRAFRAELDSSPVEYLTAVRLERAKELLRLTDRKLAAVARDAGFRDEKYFSRVFRRALGKTPGAWRRQFRGG